MTFALPRRLPVPAAASLAGADPARSPRLSLPPNTTTTVTARTRKSRSAQPRRQHLPASGNSLMPSTLQKSSDTPRRRCRMRRLSCAERCEALLRKHYKRASRGRRCRPCRQPGQCSSSGPGLEVVPARAMYVADAGDATRLARSRRIAQPRCGLPARRVDPAHPQCQTVPAAFLGPQAGVAARRGF